MGSTQMHPVHISPQENGNEGHPLLELRSQRARIQTGLRHAHMHRGRGTSWAKVKVAISGWYYTLLLFTSRIL